MSFPPVFHGRSNPTIGLMASSSINAARLQGAAKHLPESGLVAVAWAGVGTAFVFLSLRLFTRFREARQLFSDDLWVLFAFIVLIVNAILQTLQAPQVYYLVYLSAGRYQVGEETLVQGNQYVRYEFAIIALFWTVLWSVKASFLALYHRLFQAVNLPYSRWFWWFVSVFTFLAYVGCWLASAYTCHPPSNYFHFGMSVCSLKRTMFVNQKKTGQCEKPIDVRGGTISISYSTAVDVLTDILIMLLPIPLIRELQITPRQKAGLFVVFALGVFIIASAIVRMTQILTHERTDPVGLAVWGLVESSISVIIGSLPPLKALLQKKLSRYYYSQRRAYGKHSRYESGEAQDPTRPSARNSMHHADAVDLDRKRDSIVTDESIALEDGVASIRSEPEVALKENIVVQGTEFQFEFRGLEPPPGAAARGTPVGWERSKAHEMLGLKR